MNFKLFFTPTKRSFSTTNSYKNNIEVRVRFAPSPTGNIHLGGLRTALYNYIFAKQNGGKFILRIEDTDRTRIVPDSAKNIEDTLNWASLKPDESPILGGNYGPYLQSARLNLYKQRANELLDTGRAYRCFCSPTRLDLLRKYQSRNREIPRYDGKCKSLSPDEIEEKLSENDNRHVIRFALKPGLTSFEDLIFGKISNDLIGSQEGDPVILKSDDYPTYHFANVVDDNAMKISHVLRGSEWISSTAKHIQLYQAFGWIEPRFVHLPLIKMRDGSKMSKRNNHSHVKSWIEDGYRPLALLNSLTNMGGGLPKGKQDHTDLWDLETIIDNFDFSRVSCHPGSVDVNRLSKYNSKDLQKTWRTNPNEILDQFKKLLAKKNITTDLDDKLLITIINQFIVDRIVTLNDLLSEENTYIWRHPPLTWCLQEYSDKGWDLRKILESVITIVSDSNIEDRNSLDLKLRGMSDEFGIDRPSLLKLLRKLLTNSENGQPVYEIFNCLGKARLLNYLDKGLKYVS